MSGRLCVMPNCQRRGKRAVCCDQVLCEDHADSVLKHDCPGARRLEEIASDPKKLKAWRADNAPEETLTTEVIAALRATVPGLWRRTKRQPKAHSKDDTTSVLDVEGIVAPEGIHCEVETKNAHRDGCACGPCEGQRDRADEVRGAGGIAVLGIRNVQQAVDAVRMEIARRRGSPALDGPDRALYYLAQRSGG